MIISSRSFITWRIAGNDRRTWIARNFESFHLEKQYRKEKNTTEDIRTLIDGGKQPMKFKWEANDRWRSRPCCRLSFMKFGVANSWWRRMGVSIECDPTIAHNTAETIEEFNIYGKSLTGRMSLNWASPEIGTDFPPSSQTIAEGTLMWMWHSFWHR